MQMEFHKSGLKESHSSSSQAAAPGGEEHHQNILLIIYDKPVELGMVWFFSTSSGQKIFDGSCEHITNIPINPQHRRAFETASLQSPEHQIWSRAAQDPHHDWTIPSSIEIVSIYLGGSWVLLLVWSRSKKSKIQLSRICSPVSSTTGADRNHCVTSPVMGKCS